MPDTPAHGGYPEPPPQPHRVVLEFNEGLFAMLICPASGCEPPQGCSECGRSFGDPESKPCDLCADDEPWREECCLRGWFENLSPDELLTGRIELPIANVAWATDEGPTIELGDVKVA